MEKYKKSLKKNKLKITPKRVAIINYFLKNDKYFTPFDIWKYMKNNFKKIGLPTVYRNLAYFEKIGILTKIEGEENRFYYGICKEEKNIHHHHIVCISCHKVDDFGICNFEEIKNDIEKKTGFIITEHQFFLKGLCKNCKRR
ncbi:MAG TPA: transcriptional repressor [bacterium]|nr:transcriptional repressor [bacterium]HOM25993.1 transcriptional repressor [bacterium]